LKVADLIVDSAWCLKEPALQQGWPLIQQTPITDAADSWNWTETKTEIFTYASAYDSVRLRAAPFDSVEVVWKPNLSPKMFACLLRALPNKLLTRSFLSAIGVAQADTCTLCMSASETRDHLFLSCPFSAYLWTLCKLKLGISSA